MQNRNGVTALAVAAIYGCTAEARLLLEHGAKVNTADNLGNHPLIRAAMASGDAGRDVARLLLDNRAAVNHQTKKGSA